MNSAHVIITCEHAVNVIPKTYQPLFNSNPDILDTHRAVDLGALEIAQHFSSTLHCPLITATASRLLIDCNRSLTHPHCFSEFTDHLSSVDKQSILDTYYYPFRQQAESLIQQLVRKGEQVIHLSIHSFTPVLDNEVRNAEIGLLYNPKRAGEKYLATQWRNKLKKETPYRVRMNYPYLGISDGFVTSLRKRFSEKVYLGFEVESNASITKNANTLSDLKQHLVSSFLHCE